MNDPLSFVERDGLTIWGETISAQCRERGQLALHIMEGAPTDVDGVVILPAGDIAKLYALLAEGSIRGAW